MKNKHYLPLSLLMVLLGCVPVSAQKQRTDVEKVRRALETAKVPPTITEGLIKQIRTDPDPFVVAISTIMSQDPYLWRLVDKSHGLDPQYVPDDLDTLKKGPYLLNRAGLQLRHEAALALENMAKAARIDGVTLVISSCYRSYEYQKKVYERNVNSLGQAAADRESARPGHSQHQLGLAVDFGSIDDAFAKTVQSSWLLKNAWRFGWSLSYPENLEHVTGYRWESWHYRYVGPVLSSFIRTYFEDVQQYALAFLYYYYVE